MTPSNETADSDQPDKTHDRKDTPVPQAPTAEQIDPDLAARAAANMARMKQIEAEAREDYHRIAEEEKAQAKAEAERVQREKDMLTRRLLDLAKKAPSELPRDPRVPEWIDPLDPQSVRNAELFRADVEECASQRAGKYQLTDVEDARAAQIISRFIEGVERGGAKLNLVIQGPTGSGKTATAIAAGKEALRRGLRTRMVNHSHFIAATRPNAVLPEGLTLAQYVARYAGADLLIVDDLGASQATGQTIDQDTDPRTVRGASEHVVTKTMELIGDRATAGKYTIITTNLRYPHIEALFGRRFGSRLAMELVAVKMEGVDRRNPNTDW